MLYAQLHVDMGLRKPQDYMHLNSSIFTIALVYIQVLRFFLGKKSLDLSGNRTHTLTSPV